MKMHKFTLGAVAGITSVALAIPILAQVSNAATATTGTTTSTSVAAAAKPPFMRGPLTQQQVLDMVAKETAVLKNIDAVVAIQKSATQAHITALTAAAAITDDTARQAAVKKANDDQRATVEAAIAANPDLKASMPFGGGMMMHGEFGGKGGHGRGGPNMAGLATKLGMTEVDLKAAIDGGKTIQQIATEKGVTLPAPPMGMMGRHHGPMGNDNDADDVGAPATTTSSVTAQ